ncbi:MAG TPA: sigma-54 dependent transcriptional regulator [Hyphomicrobiales bacterium]|nr:sigma-54 dependent transcriptional regulator [Hyphomicrobiales bacterium]
MARVLLVDDDTAFLEATADLLGLLGHSVQTAASVAEAREKLAKGHFDRVFLDLMLPDGSGFHLLDHVDTERTRVTIITGHPAVKAQVMNLYGLNVNYLIKPLSLDQLQPLFEPAAAEADDDTALHFGELIGETPVMRDLYDIIERVAGTGANVMLLGESGVGKEMVARAIHNASGRSGPFLATNCGAFSSELIGSELFGHEKGAFTGALARRSGLFEEASGGTLFLDEITEMPLGLQTNLLRVLETRTVTPVGSTTAIAVDARVISATNRSEEELVEHRCMREDLYYRLAVFPLQVPALRERTDDIPLLVRWFLRGLNRENGTHFSVNDADLARLADYDWPGNVRELRHIVHRACIMTKTDAGELRFPERFGSPFSRSKQPEAAPTLVGRTIEDVERQLILETLSLYDNNKTRAAEVLGVSVKTLYNRLGAYEADNERSN